MLGEILVPATPDGGVAASARRGRNGGCGEARAFLTQVEEVLGTCLERGIRVVANAGGLDAAGCAAAVREVAARSGLQVRVAHVEGDDLRGSLEAITPAPEAQPVFAVAVFGS